MTGSGDDQSTPKQPDAKYSQEFPANAHEREQAKVAIRKVDEDREKSADPRDNPAPFDGTTFHGTEDPSRFSTPPPPKP